jgi:hypothetical protein
LLDEPTTGLHFDDVRKLLEVLHRLTDLGNTIIIIEHNLDVIRNADWILDLGPEGGEDGGHLVGEGRPAHIAHIHQSYTGQFLKRYYSSYNGHLEPADDTAAILRDRSAAQGVEGSVVALRGASRNAAMGAPEPVLNKVKDLDSETWESDTASEPRKKRALKKKTGIPEALGAPDPGSPSTALRRSGGDPSHLGTGEGKPANKRSSEKRGSKNGGSRGLQTSENASLDKAGFSPGERPNASNSPSPESKKKSRKKQPVAS